MYAKIQRFVNSSAVVEHDRKSDYLLGDSLLMYLRRSRESRQHPEDGLYAYTRSALVFPSCASNRQSASKELVRSVQAK